MSLDHIMNYVCLVHKITQTCDCYGDRIKYLESERDALKAEMETLKVYKYAWKRKAEGLEKALRKIALEPLGASDATHKEVLAMAEAIAKAALDGFGAGV